MQRYTWPVWLIILASATATAVWYSPAESALPPVDFAHLSGPFPDDLRRLDAKSRKQRFIRVVHETAQHHTAHIYAQRSMLIQLALQLRIGRALSTLESEWLAALARRYDIPDWRATEDQLQRLIRRVDVVPASLLVAQAALESGWGTSRFARQANNLFGEWCFSEGCGVTPRARDDGASHEIRRFASISEAIESYLMNLNTHAAYRDFRRLRELQRLQARPLNGNTLASGLSQYSQEGEHYIEKVRRLMRANALHSLDDLPASPKS